MSIIRTMMKKNFCIIFCIRVKANVFIQSPSNKFESKETIVNPTYKVWWRSFMEHNFNKLCNDGNYVTRKTHSLNQLHMFGVLGGCCIFYGYYYHSVPYWVGSFTCTYLGMFIGITVYRYRKDWDRKTNNVRINKLQSFDKNNSQWTQFKMFLGSDI